MDLGDIGALNEEHWTEYMRAENYLHYSTVLLRDPGLVIPFSQCPHLYMAVLDFLNYF